MVTRNNIQSGNYKFQLWEGTEYDITNHHNKVSAALDYIAQGGLSVLMYRVVANLIHLGWNVYTFNFDSILVSESLGKESKLQEDVHKTFNKYKFKFNFEVTTGSNYSIAQLGYDASKKRLENG